MSASRSLGEDFVRFFVWIRIYEITPLAAACCSSVHFPVVHLPRRVSATLISSLQFLITGITKSIPVTPSLHMSAAFLFQALTRIDGCRTSLARIQWLKKMIPSRKSQILSFLSQICSVSWDGDSNRVR